MKQSKTSSINSKQKTNKILAILTLLTLGITVVILGQFLILDHNTNKILQDGTVINGYNLSGMSKEEANVILIDKFQEKAEDLTLNIKTEDKNWTFTKEDFKVNSDIHPVLEASQNRDLLLGNKEKEIDLLSQFNNLGGSINVAFNYIYVGLDEKLEKIIKEVEIEPVNSEITFDPTSKQIFNITESVNGKRVDKNKLYLDINEQFLTSNNITVELPFIEEIPAITKEYNLENTQKITTFSTNVSDSTGSRKHNVKLEGQRSPSQASLGPVSGGGGFPAGWRGWHLASI